VYYRDTFRNITLKDEGDQFFRMYQKRHDNKYFVYATHFLWRRLLDSGKILRNCKKI